MDIRNWGIGQIMQLPDSCFGRRWPIIFNMAVPGAGANFFISEIGLSNICVLWELWVFTGLESEFASTPGLPISLALGDHLPVGLTEFTAMETMFPEADEIVDDARVIRGNIHLTKLRKVYQPQGRRVVLRFISVGTVTHWVSVGLVFSGIPTEVPDCLLSR